MSKTLNEEEVEKFKKQAIELKGKYFFQSPYHKTKKKLPFIVLGSISFNSDYPIEVQTVEYIGSKKKDIFTCYKYESIVDKIESGFLTKS